MTERGRGRGQDWRTQRISTRLRLKSKTCALDVRSWLEKATWGLNPNTVIAYRQGIPISALAKRYGLSRPTIYRIFRRLGV